MKCKKCGEYVSITDPVVVIKRRNKSNHEFIYKTGYCRMCLIDMGYCD